MKNKKLIVWLITFSVGILLSACGNSSNITSETTEQKEENEQGVIEDARCLIFESENLKDALIQFGNLVVNAETTEEKQEIQSYMNEYFLEDLNGFFYYKKPDKAVMHVEYDNRAIYIKSMEEVYIVPYSEQELTDMQLDLEDIPQVENSEIYKYHVAEIESTVEVNDDGEEYFKAKVIFESDYVDGNIGDALTSMRITCYSSREPMAYCSYGYFADEADMIPDSDRENSRGAARDYFRDENSASSQKAKRDEEDKDWGKSEEKEEPAIGMTKSEVTNGAWGEPDKKNIDEYEWGTHEQWVYDGKGYVYFEDGVVTSIQHR